MGNVWKTPPVLYLPTMNKVLMENKGKNKESFLFIGILNQSSTNKTWHVLLGFDHVGVVGCQPSHMIDVRTRFSLAPSTPSGPASSPRTKFGTFESNKLEDRSSECRTEAIAFQSRSRRLNYSYNFSFP